MESIIPSKPFSSNTKKKKRKSRRSGKLKKQDKIKRLILNYGNKGLQISFNQIAQKIGCTTRYAEITVAKLVKSGKVIKTHTEHISYKYKKERVFCGRNIYTSPKPKADKTDQKNDGKTDGKIRARTSRNLNKYKYANGTSHRDFSTKKNEEECSGREKFELFKSYGFQNLVEEAPDWWFKDLKGLKKALKLLKNKLKRGYGCRNKINFITFLLKHGIFGYRRHCARNLSLAVNRPTLKRIEPLMANEAVAQGYEALRELRTKHGLDVSFMNMEKLLRKKYPHLSTAAQVMLKRLKLPGIKNMNSFLHFLIGMDEPYNYLKRKETQ